MWSAKDNCKGNNVSTIAPMSIAQHTAISSLRLSSMFAKVHTSSSSGTLQDAIHFCIAEIDNNHTWCIDNIHVLFDVVVSIELYRTLLKIKLFTS